MPSEPSEGTKETEQLPEERVQLGWLKVPALLVKVTVPVGVTGVPASVSDTLAEHVVAELTGKEGGEQTRVVDVVRCVTESSKVFELASWFASPG
jgi:hypothetical protein